MRSRIQLFDATFGTERVDSFPLTYQGRTLWVKHQKESRVFDDTQTYWFAEKPDSGVKVPTTGTTLTVTRQRGTSLTVQVGPSPGA